MTRPASDATPTPKRSRRRLAGVSIALGIAVLIPDGAATVLATERPVFGQLLQPDGVKTARRIPSATPTPPPPPPPAAPAPMSGESSNNRFARDVIDLTNAARSRAGIAPLAAIPELALAASFHVEDQKDRECSSATLSHTGSDGSHGVDRILRTGLDISRWGENIACGHTTPEAVVRGWMNSPSHRANVLDARLTHIGVNVAVSDTTGLHYWVQNFATLR